MTVFESIKNKNIDEFVDFIEENFSFDNAPYWKWWDDKYCKKCDEVVYLDEEDNEYIMAYCELYGNCKFFKDMKEIPDSKHVIKMWLESKVDNQSCKKKCSSCKYFIECESFDDMSCDLFESK